MNILLVYLRRDENLYNILRKKEGIRYLKADIARPLALEILASLTPTDIKVKLIDDNFDPIDFDGDFDLVGLYAHDALTAYRGKFVYQRFKKRGIPVIIGGRFIQTIPPEVALECADSCVMSEVEDIWLEILGDVRKKELKRVYQSNVLVDLARKDLPIPRRDLIKNNHYHYRYLTIEVARGCINNCNFCTASLLFKSKYRTYPIDRIEADLQNVLLSFDQKSIFYFVDEDIGLYPEYKIELFQRIGRFNIPWIALAGAGIGKNDRLLSVMSKSGCKMLYIGFETLDEDNLKSINKSGINKVKDYKEIVEKIHAHKIGVCGLFIFGLDNDKKGVAKQTLRFVKEAKLDLASASILTPIYNSPIYLALEEEKRIISREWFKYWHKVVHKPMCISPEELRNEFNYFTKISDRMVRRRRFFKNLLSSIWKS